MKVLSILFAIYVLWLTFTPCVDLVIPVSSYAVSVVQNQSKNIDSDSCTGCSPFCVCNCCHSNTLVSLSIPLSCNSNILFTYKNLYIADLVNVLSGSIWQPPKFV